ncbi:sensor domain-containing diguanylate cyclase [Magnetospirillum molischianum]|uniref:sensor domain-containing diguanylate cyclase n=1 Tax=Magnetospirillum molischianum TaxID=1083 RepID=UPI00138B171E|nr:diguanylate cyclase [Magnetospirillum molischianum]
MLAWIGLWALSYVLGYDRHASLWFPPSALDVALFLAFGWAAIPMVWIGAGAPAILSSLMLDNSIGWNPICLAVVYGAIHVVSYGGFAWVLNRSRLPRDKIDHVGVGFLWAPLFCGIAAIGGVLNLAAFTNVTLAQALELAPGWWIGDLIAVSTLTLPFLCIIHRGRFGTPFQAETLNWLVLTTVLFCTSSYLVYLSAGRIPVSLEAYLQLLPLLWATHRLSPISISILVSWSELLFVVRAMLFGVGEGAFEYQGAMLAIGAITYVGTAIPTLLAERSHFQRLASTDGLTGLMNRTSFCALAESELARTRRRGGILSVAMIDLDHFKRINDTMGHSIGDQALKKVSDCLSTVVRTGDLVARWGGEEFVVCFPDTALGSAMEISERLGGAITTLSVGNGTVRAMLSASIGVAEIGDGESLSDAINRADSALYMAKNAGRNRVLSADLPSLSTVVA